MRAIEMGARGIRHGSTRVILSAALAGCGGGGPSMDPVPTGSSSAWPSLGLDAHNTRNNKSESVIHASNVAELEPRWLALDVTTGVTSTPAVVDGVVYFAEWGGTIRAVRAEDGAEIWRAKVVDGLASSSPLVRGDVVYVSSGSHVQALQRTDGTELWRTQLDSHPLTHLDSSPAWADGQIVIGVAGRELSLDLADFTFRGSVVGLDAATGRENWRVYTTNDDGTSGAGVSVWSSAAVDETRHLAFIGTGNTYEEPASPYSDALLAIDYEAGELVWHHQFTEGDVYVVPRLGPGPDEDIGASPNLFAAGGRDLVGVGSKAGLYKALDRETGEVIWERMLGEGSAIGGIMTTSAVGERRVYVNSNRGVANSVTTALDLGSGDTVWEAEMPTSTYGALSLAGDVLYQPTSGGIVHAINRETGEVLWTVDLESDLAGGISIVDGTVYAPRGFRFPITRFRNAGGVVAFSLDGSAPLDFSGQGAPMDGGADVSVAQCIAETSAGLTHACKDCACECKPTAAATCDESCWTFSECVVSNCTTADFSTSAGAQCVEDNCNNVKLLPPAIQDAVTSTAECMVACQLECAPI